MRPHHVVLLVVASLGLLACNEPDRVLRVAPNDAVRCCFYVPYDGLVAPVLDEQCLPRPVCPRPGDENAEDVCMPLACKSGDDSPYGRSGPKGTVAITGNCTLDVEHTRIEPGGCGGME